MTIFVKDISSIFILLVIGWRCRPIRELTLGIKLIIKLLKEYQKIKKEYEDHKRQKQQQDLMGFT